MKTIQRHICKKCKVQFNSESSVCPSCDEETAATDYADYLALLQIPGIITAGWLVGQAMEADANAKALVERGVACAADAWFALANAYRSEAEVISSRKSAADHTSAPQP